MWFVGVGWHAWVSLVVDDVLFVLELMSLLMVGVRLAGAFRSVVVRRWRIYCMMLVSGFRWFVGLGCWFVCVALGQRLWRSLMVESVLLYLVVDDGLIKLALWGSVLVDGRVFDGVGWCMLVSLWVVGGLVDLDFALMVVMMSLVGGPLGCGCERLFEDGWVVVVLMVGKCIFMVVWDRRRRDLWVRAG